MIHALDSHVAQLMEEYDSVIIFATKNEDSVTKSAVRRGGNYYACKGQIIEWLEECRNEELARALKDAS